MNLEILPLCTEPWNDTSYMSKALNRCQISQADRWIILLIDTDDEYHSHLGNDQPEIAINQVFITTHQYSGLGMCSWSLNSSCSSLSLVSSTCRLKDSDSCISWHNLTVGVKGTLMHSGRGKTSLWYNVKLIFANNWMFLYTSQVC